MLVHLKVLNFNHDGRQLPHLQIETVADQHEPAFNSGQIDQESGSWKIELGSGEQEEEEGSSVRHGDNNRGDTRLSEKMLPFPDYL